MLTNTDLSAVRALLPTTAYARFNNDTNINYQLNRFLIPGKETVFSEIGACVRTFDDWKSAFLAAASQSECSGEAAEAARFYRAAEFFMSPGDPDRRHAFYKFIDLTYRTEAARGAKRFAVPFAGARLNGFRIEPSGAARGTIVAHGGFDSYCEEFFDIARAFAASGYEVAFFDGPGQGSTLMREHMPMTPAWHEPVSAVLNHLAIQEATLIGISLGGCLALRAAAFEARIKRVIAFDVMLDFFQCVVSRRGPHIERTIRALLALRLDTLVDKAVGALMARDLYSRWGIEQGMHVTGSGRPSEFLRKLRHYTTRDISERLTQHVLIMAGAEDHFVPLVQLHEQLPMLSAARSVTAEIFTGEEQAGAHCQVGNQGVAVERMISWISSRTASAHRRPE